MKIEVVRETRFAVVMYGGVSLAIYINGVAQELLRLVRATAIEADGDGFRVKNPTPVEKLYRDIGFLVADRSFVRDSDLLDDYCAWLESGQSGQNPLERAIQRDKKTEVKTTRFVVDILSGTSAGGINGVYMAKALVSGQQLDALETLWRTEGSFRKLLNDDDSIADIDGEKRDPLGLEKQIPPRSLLNSERMYLKLLNAFAAMDDAPTDEPKDATPEEVGPYVDEVDLFVTLTDFWGIPVPLRLFDQLIYERRHRQNLHFRFRKDDKLNEFAEKYYPFLAFAARSTSSFPLAFEPMQIDSANAIIDQVRKADGNSVVKSLPGYKVTRDIWKNAFRPTTLQVEHKDDVPIEWNKRIFVDGGYLDNKPFGYAIEALAQKQSDVLVDRKLIYVEPQPDLDDGKSRVTNTQPPGVLENTMAALTSMPRYETIREDLQEVLERNDLIVRINQLVTDARKDELESLRLSLGGVDEIIRWHKENLEGLIEKYKPGTTLNPAEFTVSWNNLELCEIAQQKGAIAYPYYRLRVATLTDSLARMVTQRAGYDEESDYFLAVRDLVFAWRRQLFSRGEEQEGDERETNIQVPTPMLFLRDYDFDYRLRRLRFVLQQADRLLQFDQPLQNELKKTRSIAVGMRERFKGREFSTEDKRALINEFSLVNGAIFDLDGATPSEVLLKYRDGEDLWKTVRSFKKTINDILRDLRTELRQVQPQAEVDPDNLNKQLIEELNEQVGDAAVKIGRGLKALLGVKDPEEGEPEKKTQLDSRNNSAVRQKRAEKFLDDNPKILGLLNTIGATLRTIYNAQPKEESYDAGKRGSGEFRADRSRARLSIFGKSRNRVNEVFYGAVENSDAQTEIRSRIPSDVSDELYLAVRSYLLHFYENFDAYDQIVFPITYKTPIGEGALIDVARISPLDSTNLIDEREELKKEAKAAKQGNIIPGKEYRARRKLAGGVFMAFGAFFAEPWRKNDILWGRLDAAERLVSIALNDNLLADVEPGQASVLKDSLAEVRRALTDQLHEKILHDTDWVKKTYDEKKDGHARIIDFVRDEKQRLITRKELEKKKAFATSARSAAILDEVLQPDELGRTRLLKEFSLGLSGLMLRSKPGRLEKLKFANRFLKSSVWLIALAVYIVGILSLAPSIIAWLWSGSPIWFLGVLLGTIAIYVIAFNTVWKRAKNTLEKLIYSKVTGSDG